MYSIQRNEKIESNETKKVFGFTMAECIEEVEKQVPFWKYNLSYKEKEEAILRSHKKIIEKEKEEFIDNVIILGEKKGAFLGWTYKRKKQYIENMVAHLAAKGEIPTLEDWIRSKYD